MGESSWVQCMRCGYHFDSEKAKDKGIVYINNHDVGIACDSCKELIFNPNKDKLWWIV